MPEYTLKIRRYDPQSGEAAYWEEHSVEMPETQSVLDAILEVKAVKDGSIGIRCSCQQAICGSCGVRMNGKPGLACNTHLEEAARRGHGMGWNPPDEGQESPVITVEPMGNMPVIRDLIVDMDAVHWKKVRRVTPWLINKEPVPEREYVVPHENMVDVTQTMACIQCGACVSDCLAMEVDPLFVGPAALAKSYRFVGDPRDAQHGERLKDLAEDEHGIYDCTHCFNCIDACPKGVDPMSQIMRLRPKTALGHPHKASKEVKRIFEEVEGREERYELNLYVTGYEDAPEEEAAGEEERDTGGAGQSQGQPEAKGAEGRQPPAEGSAAGGETQTESESS